MSAKNTAQCSEITLPEIGGLIINLIQKLMGKRARFWLNALKRLDRKENPWIPFRKIMEVPSGGRHTSRVKDSLEILSKMEIQVFDCMYTIEDRTVSHLSANADLPKHDIVLLKIGDLLTLEERQTYNYRQLLKKAAEHGFEPCDLRSGLMASVVLVRESMSDGMGHGYPEYIICTEPMLCVEPDGGKQHERVPKIAIKKGDRSPFGEHEQGLITRIAVDMRLKGRTLDTMENPETFLVFRSIPW